MTDSITSRLDEDVRRNLNRIVASGRFRSRSDAINRIVKEYIENHPELLLGTELQERIESAPDLTDEELEQLSEQIFKGKSVVDLIAEGRQR